MRFTLVPIVERLVGTRFWSLYRQSLRDRKLSDEAQWELQRLNIQQLVSHAVQHVPLWRERLTAVVGLAEIATEERLSSDALERALQVCR